MVLFGAPKYLARQEYQVVHAAIEMVEGVHRLIREGGWQERYEFPGFRIGVGIHTGEVIATPPAHLAGACLPEKLS
jgi:hypothetical protein